MKKIKIFIGSSIVDLHDDRLSIVSFIQELNNKYIDRGIYIEPYICEEKSGAMRIDGSQNQHDEYIENNADAAIFMFFKKAGKFTLHELEIAYNTLKETMNRPNIFIFFKTDGKNIIQNEEISRVARLVSDSYQHYFKSFSNADTIKLEILQYMVDKLGDSFNLSVFDGKIYLNEDEIDNIDISNIFAYQNNKDLQLLKKQTAEIETKINKCTGKNDYAELGRLLELRNGKITQITTLESDLFRLLTQINKNLKTPGDKHIYKAAYKLVEDGRIREAISLLPDTENIKIRTERLAEQKRTAEHLFRQNGEKIMQDALTRIELLKCDIANDARFYEIEELYDSITDLLSDSGYMNVLHEYCFFLKDLRKYEKSINLIENLLDRLEDFKTEECYFCLLNLLAVMYEVLGNTTQAKKYYKILIQYCKNKDMPRNKSDLGMLFNNIGFMYKNLCAHDAAQFENAQKYLKEAVKVREKIYSDNPNDKSALSDLVISYNNLGLLYEQRSEALDSAEYYLKRAVKKCSYLADDENGRYVAATSYNNLAYLYMNNTATAEKYYRKSLDLFEKLYTNNKYKYFYQYATIYSQLSGIINRSHPETAAEYAKTANEIMKPFLKKTSEWDLLKCAAMCNYHLFNAYFTLKRFKDSERAAIDALSYCDILRRRNQTIFSTDADLTDIYTKMKFAAEISWAVSGLK